MDQPAEVVLEVWWMIFDFQVGPAVDWSSFGHGSGESGGCGWHFFSQCWSILGPNIFKQKSSWIACLINYWLIFVDALISEFISYSHYSSKEEKNGCKRKIFYFVIKVFSFYLFTPRFDQIFFPKGMKYAKWTFTSFSAKVNVSYSSFKTFANTIWKLYIELHSK